MNEVMNHDQEVVSIRPGEDAAMTISPMDLREIARTGKERAQALRDCIDHAMDVTDHWDWVIMGSGKNQKVYLTGAGAEKIGRFFGISWGRPTKERHEREDGLGKYYYWEYTCTFRGGDVAITEIGTCSSRDPFFAKKHKEWIPSEDVDETNVMKAAWTNCITRGITGLIGLRNFPLERLPERLQKAPRVEYQEGKYGGGGQNRRPDGDMDKAREIGQWLLELHDGDATAAADDLEARTKFTVKDGEDAGKEIPGKRELKKLSAKQIEYHHGKIREQVEAYRLEHGTSGAPAGGEETPPQADPEPPAEKDSVIDGSKPPWSDGDGEKEGGEKDGGDGDDDKADEDKGSGAPAADDSQK